MEVPSSTSELDGLHAAVARLNETIRSLDARVAALEQGHLLPESVEPAPETEAARPAGTGVSTALWLTGRSFLVLGGAFLLRALTDTGVFPPLLGIAVGLAYALVWLAFAARAGRGGAAGSAAAHGLVSTLIGFPLLVEVSSRFGILGPTGAAAALAGLTGAGLITAWRARLASVHWFFALGAPAAVWVLLGESRVFPPFVLSLLVLALATFWLGYGVGWRWPTRLVTLQADVLVAAAVLLILRPGGPPAGAHGLGTASGLVFTAALAVLFLGSIAVWTLVRRRPVTPFEVIQTVLVMIIGFGGFLLVARDTGIGLAAGVMTLAAGAVGYAFAFTLADRRRTGAAANFYYFSWTAAGFVFLGALASARGPGLTVILTLFALAAAALGSRFRRMTLRYHAAAFILAAAVQSGTLATVLACFFSPASRAWEPLGFGFAVVSAAAAGSYALLAATQRAHQPRWYRLLPRCVTGALAVGAVGCLLVRTLVPLLTPAPPASDPGVLAVTRTAVLAMAAVVLGFAGRRAKLVELAWLVYPLLAAGALKLLVEDFPQGRPATLFPGLAFYGLALITAARMLLARQRLAI